MVQVLLSSSLLASLIYAGWMLGNSGIDLPLPGWSKTAAWLLVIVGAVAFGLRTIALIVRLMAGRRPM
jgi:hypothetical protein